MWERNVLNLIKSGSGGSRSLRWTQRWWEPFHPDLHLGKRNAYMASQCVISNFLVAPLKKIKKTQVKLIFRIYFI